MTAYALTVDAGARDLRAADHLLHALADRLALPGDTVGCTHLVRGERPRVVVSLSLSSRPLLDTVRERLAGAGHGAVTPDCRTARDARCSSRGVPAHGTLSVAELLACSAIDRVTVLGSPLPPDPDARLVTRDHVRPQWQGDGLVLAATPALGDTLVPFEAPDPTPCCADH
ncbi:hypothetical protein [Streptomyces tendae]|uniref:Uncharacterized protein n=1 Tax=Streptomyces tendae TaxID=1932 RepID=A0ABX5ZQ79_STRTE|nr:hypothetical protein [Streptomyces tendae]QER86681.1 hypothetical protein F3L20_12915 [Streptomyces tendae]